MTDIHFSIAENGTVIADTDELHPSKDEAGNTIYLVKDKPLSFAVNKVALGLGEEIEGAELELREKDSEGNYSLYADSWISEKGKVHDFGPSLTAGKDYMLSELVAPTGYAYTTDIYFSVALDGTVTVTTEDIKSVTEDGKTVYLVEDAPLSFNVNKVDLGTGEEVEGAELTVLGEDAEGEYTVVIDKWVSKKGETHDFGPKLDVNKGYALRETVAPEGYEYVSDIYFHLDLDGTVSVVADSDSIEESKDKDGNVVYLVKDKTISKPHKTEVTPGNKELVKVGDVIEYQITYRNHYNVPAQIVITDPLDPGLTYGDSTGVYDEATHTVTWTFEAPALEEGFVSLIVSVNENALKTEAGEPQPTVYNQAGVKVANDAEQKTEIVENPLEPEEPETETETQPTVPATGSLEVTKTLEHFDTGAALRAKDATFYVALYEDAKLTSRVSDVEALIFKDAVSATVRFTGLETGRTYYIAETTADGTELLMEGGVTADGVPYVPEFTSGNSVELKDDGTVRVSFKNVFADLPFGFYFEEPDGSEEPTSEVETEIESETESETATETETEKTESVKTGDETPIALYLTLFAAALAVLVGNGFRRRRRNA